MRAIRPLTTACSARSAWGVDLATFTFTSTQEPASSPDGQACDDWSLVYTMVQAGSSWLIDRAVGENGVAYRPC